MRDKLLKIINNYGVLPQLKYFQSEVFELNEAIIEYEKIINILQLDATQERFEMYDNKRHIAGEIADVQVMLNQFKEYYNISDEEINKVMDYKINRQLDRIKGGI